MNKFKEIFKTRQKKNKGKFKTKKLIESKTKMDQIKIGDTFIVTGNSTAHGYEIGKKYIVSYIQNQQNGQIQGNDILTGFCVGYYIQMQDYKIFSGDIKSIQNEISDINKELGVLDLKIEYLDHDDENYNDSKFMAWYIVKILNSDDKDKERKISKILNSVSNNINIDILKNF